MMVSYSVTIFVFITLSISKDAHGGIQLFTSSLSEGDPACNGQTVVITCKAEGTSLMWAYNDPILKQYAIIQNYNANENCGLPEQFTNTTGLFLPQEVKIITVLASAINVTGQDRVFTCMSIMEINSTVATQGEITCISGNNTTDEDNKTFSYDVFIADESEVTVSLEQVSDSIFNVTWDAGSLEVKNIAYTTVTAVLDNTTIVIHPDETSTLLKLENNTDCRINVTVFDKCARKYIGSIETCPTAVTPSTCPPTVTPYTSPTVTTNGASLLHSTSMITLAIAIASCLYYFVTPLSM